MTGIWSYSRNITHYPKIHHGHYTSVIKWVERSSEKKKPDGCRIRLKVDVVRKNALTVARTLFILVFIIGDLVRQCWRGRNIAILLQSSVCDCSFNDGDQIVMFYVIYWGDLRPCYGFLGKWVQNPMRCFINNVVDLFCELYGDFCIVI